MSEDIVLMPCFLGFFAWLAWLIFSTIRRYKIARLQADVQQRLLEKVSSSQDLLAYAQTPAGSQLIESLRVESSLSVPPHYWRTADLNRDDLARHRAANSPRPG